MNTVETASVLREQFDFASERPRGAASWGAILGGAAAAAALSLILLALGTGLGLSSISPWAYAGAPARALGVGAIVWLLLMSALASALGGYLAGRLRAIWTDVDAEEAFFRDTAHGFLAWAVATLISAAVLTSAASSMAGVAARTATAGAAMVAAGAGGAIARDTIPAANPPDDARQYFVDMMLRTGKPAEPGVDRAATSREIARIMASAPSGGLLQGDRRYLAQLVAERTGLSPAEAEQRVNDTTTAARLAADAAQAKAREAADVARRATASMALWVFVSLLLGAFCAALAATWGGRQRDVRSYLRRPV